MQRRRKRPGPEADAIAHLVRRLFCAPFQPDLMLYSEDVLGRAPDPHRSFRGEPHWICVPG